MKEDMNNAFETKQSFMPIYQLFYIHDQSEDTHLEREDGS